MALIKAGLVLLKSIIKSHTGSILQKLVSPFMREYSYVYFYIVTGRSNSLTPDLLGALENTQQRIPLRIKLKVLYRTFFVNHIFCCESGTNLSHKFIVII